MNPDELIQAAGAEGFSLPSPAYLFGMVLFSLLGFAAWRYGKVTEHWRTRALGVALMFYPYLVGQTWLLYLVGFGLCAAIWWDQQQ